MGLQRRRLEVGCCTGGGRWSLKRAESKGLRMSLSSRDCGTEKILELSKGPKWGVGFMLMCLAGEDVSVHLYVCEGKRVGQGAEA